MARIKRHIKSYKRKGYSIKIPSQNVKSHTRRVTIKNKTSKRKSKR